MTLPNFVGIGVQRAATTWLHACLAEHPEIFVPDEKELNFFNNNWEKGIQWYQDYFLGASKFKAVGEITPTYLQASPISRIAETLPNARILIVLREPVERTFSAYRLLNEQFEGLTFEQACEKSNYLISRSLYANPLEEVFQFYGEDKVKIFLYEEVIADPLNVLREVFQFLEVDPQFIPKSAQKKYNRILFPRTQRFLGKIGLSWAVHSVKKTPLGEWIKNQNRVEPRKHASQIPENYRQLLKEKFRPDILKVQQLIGRDLSSWL